MHEKELVQNHNSEASDPEDSNSENSDSKDSSSEDVDLEDGNSDKENTLILKNPYIITTKGSPKSSSHKNNKKNNGLVKKLLNDRKRNMVPITAATARWQVTILQHAPKRPMISNRISACLCDKELTNDDWNFLKLLLYFLEVFNLIDHVEDLEDDQEKPKEIRDAAAFAKEKLLEYYNHT
ncbi:34092_t:CDS:2, partial [Gigaspora margarita]